jgi:hypothetical protein
MAKVNVFRFDEDELGATDTGEVVLRFTGARYITRTDSAESAVKLLGLSGMRPINEDKHPGVIVALTEVVSRLGLPRPVAFLRGVHGTYVVTRENSPRRTVVESSGEFVNEPRALSSGFESGASFPAIADEVDTSSAALAAGYEPAPLPAPYDNAPTYASTL